MSVGEPAEFSPWLAYVKVKEALEAGTLMHAAGELLGDRSSPEPLLHRQFRLDPQSFDFTPKSKARPGDVVMVTDVVTVWLTHDYVRERAEACWAEACSDFVAALRALLTRVEVSKLAEPKGGRVVRRRVGGFIEQAFALSLTYHITLPEAA